MFPCSFDCVYVTRLIFRFGVGWGTLLSPSLLQEIEQLIAVTIFGLKVANIIFARHYAEVNNSVSSGKLKICFYPHTEETMPASSLLLGFFFFFFSLL